MSTLHINNWSIITLHNTGTVSYTHLDVYKRQPNVYAPSVLFGGAGKYKQNII